MSVLPPRKGQVIRLARSLTDFIETWDCWHFIYTLFYLYSLNCHVFPPKAAPVLSDCVTTSCCLCSSFWQNWQNHRWCGSQNPPVLLVTHQVTLAAGWHLVLLQRVAKGWDWAHDRAPKSAPEGACWQESRVPTAAGTNLEQPSSQHKLHLSLYI